ncbi:GNAT family acetyltransferase [Oleidesulfovibrio sp.]|uniref:GNAT family acetyltransferase n=1 Tax=Oleidesulfovibrio sp. TaxID=2909707 RepID=UPI003A88BAFF
MTALEQTVVRPFRPEDSDALIALWKECGLTVPWNDPYKDLVRKLSEAPQEILIAEKDSIMAGAVMYGYDGHRGSVNYLCVAPHFRQSGLGRLLMQHVEKRLTERGCPKINICVRKDNIAISGFYAAQGYQEDNVIVLGKRLTHDENI